MEDSNRAPDVQELVHGFPALSITPPGAPSGSAPPSNPQALTIANLDRHNRNHFELRMFGCKACQHLFYQKVDETKPVSKCAKCHQSLDAIPIHDEPAGLGKFRCKCGWRWTSYPAARDIKQPCFKCSKEVKPKIVIPSPLLQFDPNQRPRSNTSYKHSCYACKELPPNTNCPLRGRFGFVASTLHDSTGSTITLGDTSKYKKILSPENTQRYASRMRNHENEPDEGSDDSISTVSTIPSNSGNPGRGRGGRGRGGRGRGGQ